MKRAWKRAVSVGIAALLWVGCGTDLSGPGPYREVGVLVISEWSGGVPLNIANGEGVDWNAPVSGGDYTAPDVLVAPDTVEAGEPFEVTTHTVGTSGCWRSDGQSVATAGRTVVLEPYDSHSGSEVCTEALVFLAHRSTVVLAEVGEWTLRVDGRRLRMGDEVRDEPISAERAIVVR